MSSGDGVSRAGDAHARGVMLRQYGCGRKGEEMNEHRQDGVDRQGTGLSPAIAGSGRSGLGGVAVEANGAKEPSEFRLSTQGITFRLSSDAMYLMRPKCHP